MNTMTVTVSRPLPRGTYRLARAEELTTEGAWVGAVVTTGAWVGAAVGIAVAWTVCWVLAEGWV